MKYEAAMGTITLSRGSGWRYSLRGKPGDLWPDGETQVVFYDSRGGVIAQFDGELSPDNLAYECESDDVDVIPHGTAFELFVTPNDTGIPQMVRYGLVTRREVLFPDKPASVISDTALYWQDDFQRTILGPKWTIKQGKPKIYVNSGGKPNGVASAQQIAQSREKAAMLWYQPLNGDDLTMHVKFVNSNEGQATMLFSSDYNMTTYLGLQVIESWIGLSNKLRIVKGTGPTEMQSMQSIDLVTSPNDTFLIKFNSLMDTVQVFKNNSTTPSLNWTDSTHSIYHGEGFRYVGMNFETNALLGTGPQICAWTAKDGL